jgi:hypothetical protein
MEFVEGETLRSLIKRSGRLEVKLFILFSGNLLSEQRRNEVVYSVAIYEAGQCFDAVADCTEAESAEYQKQNHLDLRVQLGNNSWFPKSGSCVRTVLIEIDLSGRRLRGFGGTVFSKYDFQGFNCGRVHKFRLVRFSRQDSRL